MTKQEEFDKLVLYLKKCQYTIDDANVSMRYQGGAPAWLKEERVTAALNLIKFVMDNKEFISFVATKTDETDN